MFCWAGGNGLGGMRSLVEYWVEKFLQAARKVMDRRKQELSPVEEAVIRDVFAATAGERGAVAGT